jgi:hypothetical protein
LPASGEDGSLADLFIPIAHSRKPPSARRAPAVFAFGSPRLDLKNERNHDMRVRMAVEAPARSAGRPRTLVCNQDGVWLWPGTALTQRLGGTVSALPKSTIYDRVTKLHGPLAIYSRVAPCIDHAAALLSDGQVEKAQQSLDRAQLPLVMLDGALLMRTVGRRLGITPPAVPCGTNPRL